MKDLETARLIVLGFEPGDTQETIQKNIIRVMVALQSERERTARRCAEIAADDSWIEDNIKKEFSL